MISKPLAGQAAPYPQSYIDRMTDTDLFGALENTFHSTLKLYGSIPETMANFQYQEEKWSVKELLLHLCDTERIFSYRALRFSRKDATPLPGYDENDYAKNCRAGSRTLASLIEEFEWIRKNTQFQFRNLDPEQLDFVGPANGISYTPRILGWMIAGHNFHHNQILAERYLPGIQG